MKIRQQNKNANSYPSEIEDLTKGLESAYISDDLPVEVVSIYATKTAVIAIVKNDTTEKIRLIMRS